jgi:hypothetical protein
LSRFEEVKRQYEAQQDEIAKIEALEKEDEEEDKKQKIFELDTFK